MEDEIKRVYAIEIKFHKGDDVLLHYDRLDKANSVFISIYNKLEKFIKTLEPELVLLETDVHPRLGDGYLEMFDTSKVFNIANVHNVNQLNFVVNVKNQFNISGLESLIQH